MNTRKNTRTLCEGAILIALAFGLSFVSFSPVANGGSVDIAMLPIILFAVRHGVGWGAGAGFVHGFLQYVGGHGIAIDWTTIIADYLIAFTVVGLMAGIFKKNIYLATLFGGIARFIVHFVIGATVWAKWMPEEFLGLPMTNEWIYSAIYNSIYMIPCIALVLTMFSLLIKNSKMRELINGKEI